MQHRFTLHLPAQYRAKGEAYVALRDVRRSAI